MRAATFCLIGLIGTAVAEEKDELTRSNQAYITASVNLLGDCSGFFEFMSSLYKGDQPATSEQMHQLANGALMASSYLLYLEHQASGQKPKKLGEFSHYPQGRADTNKTRLAALLEQKDLDGIKAEQKRCLAAMPMQNELVQAMRDESVGRQ